MRSTQQQARAAGFLYLLLALSAPFGLLYVPSRLVVPGNAAATADSIRASEWLLRLGIASELVHQIIAVFLVLALYQLFKAVNENYAKQVVILAALILVSGADFLSAFGKPQLDVMAYLFIRLHEQGITVASIIVWLLFWGARTLPADVQLNRR